MSIGTIILIILVIALLGGFSGIGGGPFYGTGYYGGGGLGLVLIIVLVFGTKKLRNIGSDLGNAVKGFKDGMKGPAAESAPNGGGTPPQVTGQTIEGEVKKEQSTKA